MSQFESEAWGQFATLLRAHRSRIHHPEQAQQAVEFLDLTVQLTADILLDLARTGSHEDRWRAIDTLVLLESIHASLGYTFDLLVDPE